ncbi:MAG: ABC transporter ATP-binding protein, partial [Chloroflexi bacterium]|nr:ABC transporter ATP-binding protein [Chloroflexota bacterium]
MKHLVRLLTPTAGQVLVNGREISGVGRAELARKIGFVSQNPDNQIFMSSVEDDVAFALKARGLPSDETNARVRQTLEPLGLWDRRSRHPLSLPKGERARIVIAAVLAMEPDVLI